MASQPLRSPANDSLAEEVAQKAEVVVRVWERAEDWSVPRISPSQLRVLGVLARHGAMNLTRLAQEVGAIPSSASRLCDRLEAAGLLQRTASSDSRREIKLSLSIEGHRRLDGFATTRRGDFAEVLSRMPQGARAALLEGLQQFASAADQARDVTQQPA